MASEPAINRVLADLGRRLRSTRDALRISQEEAAARAGIDYKRYQRVEKGTVNVTVRTIVRIAAALDTTFWKLLEQTPRKRVRAARR